MVGKRRYDRRIERGVDIDDIDLRLRTASGRYLSSSADWHDNKERVYHPNVGGEALNLQVSGFDVSTSEEGCGWHRMRVFVTVMLEDDDRDDVDGPEPPGPNCFGVDRL